MTEQLPDPPEPVSIEQLLLRDDTWLGHSRRFSARTAVSTGHSVLGGTLLNNGWPLGNLIEICQNGMQAEWYLLGPALREIPGLTVLINPPATPFCRALIQSEFDLDRLIIVNASDKTHFVASFIELVRANIGTVLAWQPLGKLTYTELRKCSLAATEANALCVMVRPASAQAQNSPASLRLYAQLTPAGLEVTVFKQRGYLQKHQPLPVVIELPRKWMPRVPFVYLNKRANSGASNAAPIRLASVTHIRGKP